MDEVFKWIAAGGSVTTGLLIYYVWRIEPRLRAMEEAIFMQGKIDLLKLASNPLVAPELREVATQMKEEIQRKLEKSNK